MFSHGMTSRLKKDIPQVCVARVTIRIQIRFITIPALHWKTKQQKHTSCSNWRSACDLLVLFVCVVLNAYVWGCEEKWTYLVETYIIISFQHNYLMHISTFFLLSKFCSTSHIAIFIQLLHISTSRWNYKSILQVNFC